MAENYNIYDEVEKMIFYRQICNENLSGRHGRHVGMLLQRSSYNVKKLTIKARSCWENVFRFTLLYCFEKANVNMNVPICLFTCFVENNYEFMEKMFDFDV
jgi:hypothetical protein